MITALLDRADTLAVLSTGWGRVGVGVALCVIGVGVLFGVMSLARVPADDTDDGYTARLRTTHRALTEGTEAMPIVVADISSTYAGTHVPKAAAMRRAVTRWRQTHPEWTPSAPLARPVRPVRVSYVPRHGRSEVAA